ncbi:hypothetical protein J3E72DRAFT_272625 [Bipolaris maydis]|nr:hypothetical protein J3E72DRAFT_272625 [Bipolaris maydis]
MTVMLMLIPLLSCPPCLVAAAMTAPPAPAIAAAASAKPSPPQPHHSPSPHHTCSSHPTHAGRLHLRRSDALAQRPSYPPQPKPLPSMDFTDERRADPHLPLPMRKRPAPAPSSSCFLGTRTRP